MNRIWTIARREVKAMFDQPTGYVILVIFLGINAFIFFRTAYLSNVASLRPMFDFLPWIFLFFVPAVAMRSVAEDNRGGMLEIFLSQPISEAELIAGKYLGVLLVLLGALATTLLIPVGLALGSEFPWGSAIAQYLGGALLAAGFAGVGVWASSLSKSQIIAFLLSVVVMFLLILVGLDPILVGLPTDVGTFAARLGVLTHFQSIGRGLIDLRDVLYFISLAAIFLVLAYAEVMRRRLAVQGEPRKRLRYGSFLLIAILVVLNLAGGQLGGRIDLSPGHQYTLSPATKQILGSLDDITTIKLYASRQLPPGFALTRRDVTDLLADFRSAGKGKLRVIDRDPDSDPAVAKEAQASGVGPVEFNVVGKGVMQVRQGYFGIVIQHGDRHETFPLVQRTEDLEYRMVSAIRAMGRPSKPKIGLSFDPRAGTSNMLRAELEKQYAVESPTLNDSTPLSPDLQALVIASNDDALPQTSVDKVHAYLAQGGRVFLMEAGMSPPSGSGSPYATARPVGYNPAIAPFGVTIRSDMVYDLKLNQTVQMNGIMMSYPYFVRAQSTHQSPINSGMDELSVMWGSSIEVSKLTDATITALFVTTRSAGAPLGEAVIDPATARYSQKDLGVRVLAAQSMSKDSKTRVVVAGQSRLLSDQTLQRDPSGLLFALNSVDWLTADEALMSIRAKDRRPPPLVFSSESLRQLVKYLNVAGLPLLIALVGVTRLVRRRRLASKPYVPSPAVAA